MGDGRFKLVFEEGFSEETLFEGDDLEEIGDFLDDKEGLL